MTTDKSSLATEITKKLRNKYELEDEFVTEFEELVLQSLAPFYIYNSPPDGGSGKKGKGKGPRKPRKSTAYNHFVKAKLQEDSIKDCPHQERMKKIADLWKNVSPEEKKTFQDMADEQNAKLGENSDTASNGETTTSS